MPVTMSGTMSSARMASPKTPKSPVNHAPVESDSQRLQRTLGQSGQWYGMYNPNGMKQTDSPTEFSQLESKARAAWDDKFEKTSGSGESGLFDYGMFASMDQRAGINGGWSTATQGAGSLEQQLGPVGARIARENMRQQQMSKHANPFNPPGYRADMPPPPPEPKAVEMPSRQELIESQRASKRPAQSGYGREIGYGQDVYWGGVTPASKYRTEKKEKDQAAQGAGDLEKELGIVGARLARENMLQQQQSKGFQPFHPKGYQVDNSVYTERQAVNFTRAKGEDGVAFARRRRRGRADAVEEGVDL